MTNDYKETGLSAKNANIILQKYGQNQVVGKKPPSDFYFLIKQFKNPLVLVLVVAIVITIFMKDFSDAVVIAIAVIVNTSLGFIQERKAFKSLESLKKVVDHTATVIRDGKRIEINVKEIVPGDVVALYEGDKVPADGLVIENNDLLIEEAILTGESMPVDKSTYDLIQISSLNELLTHSSSKISKINAEYKAFMGTVITSGSGKIIVTHTGMSTQFGNIASHLQEHQKTVTPLEKKLNNLAKFITVGVLLLSTLVFVTGILTNRDPVEMFTTAVAIAVATIPEGLVIGLTAILAIGMNRILKRKGLVRSLVAAETLGSVTTVCIDKTGTLTQGKMAVAKIKTDNEKLLYAASTLANDSKDPIEVARLAWARKYATENKNTLPPEQLIHKYKRTASIPFSVERRFLAVLINKEIFLAGAPEEMLERSDISKKEKNDYLKLINTWAIEGKRLIGYGYYKLESTQEALKTFSQLKEETSNVKVKWLGLMALDDPIRESVIKTIKQTQDAGINIKIITGDYSSTAIAVMKQIGLSVTKDQYMEGADIEAMTQNQLQDRLKNIILFSRTKPSQKLKIVNALKDQGEIVGMMGDGVNDAPALAVADIGIVVENSSEVAKEASELVLLDSNLSTIIAAIEEGRSMFDNLKKVTLYLLSDSFSELFIILFGLLTGTPLAISAVQILWINLIDDGLPNLALTVDPKSSDLLNRKPLPKSTRLVNTEMLFLILIISITTAIGCLAAFHIFLPTHGLETARTIVFAILSIDSLLYVFSCRSLEKNIWHEHPFNNKPLLFAVGIGFILTILSIYLTPLQTLLGTTALTYDEWIIVGLISLFVIFAIETFKWLWNYFSRNKYLFKSLK